MIIYNFTLLGLGRVGTDGCQKGHIFVGRLHDF